MVWHVLRGQPMAWTAWWQASIAVNAGSHSPSIAVPTILEAAAKALPCPCSRCW